MVTVGHDVTVGGCGYPLADGHWFRAVKAVVHIRARSASGRFKKNQIISNVTITKYYEITEIATSYLRLFTIRRCSARFK